MKLFIITLNTTHGTQEFLQYSHDLSTCAIAQSNIGFSVRAIEEIPQDLRPEGIPWLVDQNYKSLRGGMDSF